MKFSKGFLKSSLPTTYRSFTDIDICQNFVPRYKNSYYGGGVGELMGVLKIYLDQFDRNPDKFCRPGFNKTVRSFSSHVFFFGK